MRDLSTVELGETIYLYAHGLYLTSGTYMGVSNRRTIVAAERTGLGIINVDVDSAEFHFEDAAGRLLGWVMEDPPLTTIPPELE